MRSGGAAMGRNVEGAAPHDPITMLGRAARRILAKIAVDLERALAHRARHAAPGATAPRTIASGPGWEVADVLCTCGPGDHAFEERHGAFCIALVAAGAFEYRSETGAALMTPGAVMLGNAGECFECGHRHRAGDRCIAFRYAPEYFERLFADAGIARRSASFDVARIAPSRALAPYVAAVGTGVTTAAAMAWDEMVVTLAVHQYVLRARLRAAAQRLADTSGKIVDVALDSGFVDLSNFNRAFRTEFGMSPRHYRASWRR